MVSTYSRLNLLAATTVGLLACSYLFGVRDGHGDNLLLTNAGEICRIFGFLFGEGPWIDSDSIWLPNAVVVALGEERLDVVLEQAKEAVNVVLSQGEEATCALLKVAAFEAAFGMQAESYVKGLSFEELDGKLRSIGEADLLGKGLKSIAHRLGYGHPKRPSAEMGSKSLSPLALAFLVSRRGVDDDGASPGGLEDFVRQGAGAQDADLLLVEVLCGLTMESFLTEISPGIGEENRILCANFIDIARISIVTMPAFNLVPSFRPPLAVGGMAAVVAFHSVSYILRCEQELAKHPQAMRCAALKRLGLPLTATTERLDEKYEEIQTMYREVQQQQQQQQQQQLQQQSFSWPLSWLLALLGLAEEADLHCQVLSVKRSSRRCRSGPSFSACVEQGRKRRRQI